MIFSVITIKFQFINVQLYTLDECKKYREAIHLNPKYSIALTEVLAEMFSKTLMKPIETLGQSIYVFNKSALSEHIFFKTIFII